MWARGEGPEGYDQTGLPIASSLVPLASRFPVRLYWHMSFRMAGGEWEPMLLGIEPRMCSVCGKGLYRNVTLLRGGWSRCTVCDQFVHYSCLASGRTRFLKVRPRVCKVCREAQVPSSQPINSSVGA